MVVPTSLKNYTLALGTLAMVAVLVVIRAVLWSLGVEGSPRPRWPRASSVGGSSSWVW